MPLIASSIDWIQLMKELATWKISQQKCLQLKCKEKKENTEQNMQELQDNYNYNRCNILVIGILEGDRKKQKNI